MIDAAVTRAPAVFGLSVSMVEIIPKALELAESIAVSLPDNGRVIVGGQAFRRTNNYCLPKTVTVIKTIDEFTALLTSLREQHFRSVELSDADPSKARGFV